MGIARVIGMGRAGGAVSGALRSVGWTIVEPLGRGDDITDAAAGVDLLVIATPDAAIAAVAGRVRPEDSAVVLHLSGSLGLDVLEPHPRRSALHPLVSMPDARIGSARLLGGAWFAVAGDPLAAAIVDEFGGTSFEVAEGDRAAYHAAACIASNHLVALLGQVERVAASVGVPFEAYLDLARSTLENVVVVGPSAAITGPAARGDWGTVERHRVAIDPSERAAYDALAVQARRLVDEPDDA